MRLGLLREAGTIHAPARQHSSGLKRSGVTQRPHPANQSQGTNSVPLFLVYVFALVEQTLHLVLQCALCSLIDLMGIEHFNRFIIFIFSLGIYTLNIKYTRLSCRKRFFLSLLKKYVSQKEMLHQGGEIENKSARSFKELQIDSLARFALK